MRYPLAPPRGAEPAPDRTALLAAASAGHPAARRLSKSIKDGVFVEVEQFGGPRWTRSGCPPGCGTWANVWRGTGVFLRVAKPFASATRLSAVAEMILEVGDTEALDAFAKATPGLERAAAAFRKTGASYPEALAAAAVDQRGGCRCGSAGPNATTLGPAAFLERISRGDPADWCAGVCGNGRWYHRQEAPWAALDAMLATLSCFLGYGAVVLTSSYNDNGLVPAPARFYRRP